jgi:hypothetical protein
MQDATQARIAALEARNAAQEARIAALEAQLAEQAQHARTKKLEIVDDDGRVGIRLSMVSTGAADVEVFHPEDDEVWASLSAGHDLDMPYAPRAGLQVCDVAHYGHLGAAGVQTCAMLGQVDAKNVEAST